MASSHFLATTALSQFWDQQADRVMFLGDWCLRYDRRRDWQDLHYAILPHPWDDREAMHRAAQYEEGVYEQLLAVLADYLNQAHGESHGLHYWRIILGPWLLHYVQVLHERYLCLSLVLDRYPDLETIGLATSCFRTPRYFWDHLRGSTDDPYNLQLYTALLRAMGQDPPRRELDWNWEESSVDHSAPWWKRGRRWLRGQWRRLGFYWARRSPVLLVDMYLSRQQIFQLMGQTGFKARWCELPQPETWLAETAGSPATLYRQGLGHLVVGQTDSFVRVLINTLPAHLPLLYLEGYRACREWVQRSWDRSHTRTAVTANALIGNETFKFLAAALTERSVRLIDVQHGGAYGSARYNPMEVLQKGTGDQVWSWGWSGESANGVKPMPNPKLSLLAQKRRAHTAVGRPYIFYVGNIIPRYHYRTWSCPTAGQGAQYLDWQVRFLKALQAETRAGLIFRPYPTDYGWDLRRRLLDACPGLRLDDPANDYYAGLQDASLVVCDMNQTTLLESLAANIPTIAFWDPRLWELRAEAEADFQLLRAAGILHHEPEAAAAAVHDFWPQVKDWWNQTGVQQAREQFVQRHALNSPEWARQWCDCLNNIIADKLPEGLDRGRPNHF